VWVHFKLNSFPDEPIHASLACHLLSNWLKLFLSQTLSHMNIPTVPQIQSLFTFLPVKMEQTECSEMSANKIQTPGNYPEENIQHTEHSESLKSRII
jgi:hypothetical protein